MAVTNSLFILPIAVLSLCAVALVGCEESVNTELQPEVATRPNVILILADDIGVETIGAYGSEYPTPNIDSIAVNGLRFDEAHATPICTPSRVRLLTGRYNYKNYVDFAVLPQGEKTLAHHFRDAGYRTLVSGKWQLAGTGDADDPPGTTPAEAGFDEHLVWYMQRKDKGSRFWGPKLFDNGVERQHPPADYGPTLVNQRVIDFIGREDDRPFFIYYSMVLAHKPWVTTPLTPAAEGDKPRFAGMIAYMDLMVGRVMQTLRELGLEDDTLVVFVGDNGTHPDITSLRNGVPVRGGKWYTHDAATHVPLVLQWPDRVQGNQASSQLTEILDLFPTVLEAGGIEVPDAADGFSLAPSFSGAATGREWVFMKFDPHADYDESLSTRSRFIFDDHWKVYGDGRCYDLGADYMETVSIDWDTGAAEGCAALAGIMQNVDSGPFFHEQPGPGLPEH
ncbi:MAG: sulfatase-like hydrolase/transferase [Lysobacterales bacterium]|jgi:arylsulfatase A